MSGTVSAAIFTEKGRAVSHEPVGVIYRLGSAVTEYQMSQPAICGVIRPSATPFTVIRPNMCQAPGDL